MLASTMLRIETENKGNKKITKDLKREVRKKKQRRVAWCRKIISRSGCDYDRKRWKEH